MMLCSIILSCYVSFLAKLQKTSITLLIDDNTDENRHEKVLITFLFLNLLLF